MRAMWKGVLELGQLRVPVKLYAAVEERGVHFRLLHARDRVPVRQRLVDPHDGHEVASRDARRGIEVEKGRFVLLDPEELASTAPEPSRTIEITRCVPAGAIDVAWFDRPYWLGPDGAAPDYAALVDALGAAGRLGIARWVMRGQRRFGALEARAGHLALVSLHAAEEVVPASGLAHPEGRASSASERKLAAQLVAALEAPFDPDALRDEYRERVEKLVAAKRRGRRYAVREKPAPQPTDALGDALRRSVRAATRGRRAAA